MGSPAGNRKAFAQRERDYLLQRIERQVADGTLRIRQATPAELERFAEERRAQREREREPTLRLLT